jgi:hypothetical protein
MAEHGGKRTGAGGKPKTVADATGKAFVFYSNARAKEKTHLANLAELREREKRGELIEKTQVMADADFVGRLTRDSFMALPDRVASLLVGRTEHEILQELRREIRDTLQTISETLNES